MDDAPSLPPLGPCHHQVLALTADLKTTRKPTSRPQAYEQASKHAKVHGVNLSTTERNAKGLGVYSLLTHTICSVFIYPHLLLMTFMLDFDIQCTIIPLREMVMVVMIVMKKLNLLILISITIITIIQILIQIFM